MQPIPKALSGLLRGGATVPEKFAFPKSKDSKALKFIPVSTNNVHDDIGAPGYDSDVFFASGLKLIYLQLFFPIIYIYTYNI